MKIDREKVYNKCKGHCAYCGKKMEYKSMQVDHIIPKDNYIKTIDGELPKPLFLEHLTIYDVNHADNLLPSCRRCNIWKTTYDLELFRKQIELQLIRLERDVAGYRLAKDYGLISEIVIPVVFYFEKIKKIL